MKFKNCFWTVILLIGVSPIQPFAQEPKSASSRYGNAVASSEAAENRLAAVQQETERLRREYEAKIARFRNTPEAQKLFTETKTKAEAGDASAQLDLGNMYYSGLLGPKDAVESAKWTRKSAEQGNGFAQLAIGLRCKEGVGVPQDFVQAFMWFNLAAAQDPKLAPIRDSLKFQMTNEQIAEGQRLSTEFRPKTSPPIVGESTAEFPLSSGTGFVITDDGVVISSAHVVENAKQIRLVTSAGLISAKVVKVDAANDLALLKAEGRFAALPVAASRGVKLGGTVATVGFPNIGLQGFAPKLAKGEIASLSGAADDARFFQISVPVQPGNSGGALVDERGNVVGVVSAKLSAKAALAASGALPENVNYAVKSSYLLSFLESVPEVSAKLKDPNTNDLKFEDVVKSAQDAAVLVLVY